MKKAQDRLNKNLGDQLVKVFAQAIADIKNPADAEVFLTDFLTKSELTTLSKRLAVAYWLTKGRNYDNIKQNLKVSSATISSVQTLMKRRGVQLIIKKVEAEEWASKWAERIKKFVKK